jgi:hypothetical protein
MGNKIIKLLAIVSVLLTGCNDYSTSNSAVVNFTNTEHDFGLLPFKNGAECQIVFQNTGEIPLVIQNVKTSCGCTVPEWTNKPIKPKKESSLLITYDASHSGKFKKTITVFYNGKESPAILTIKGEVEDPSEISMIY